MLVMIHRSCLFRRMLFLYGIFEAIEVDAFLKAHPNSRKLSNHYDTPPCFDSGQLVILCLAQDRFYETLYFAEETYRKYEP